VEAVFVPKRFFYAQVLGLEIELLLHEASGRKDISFRLVPPGRLGLADTDKERPTLHSALDVPH
jgi:hypothetical protein